MVLFVFHVLLLRMFFLSDFGSHDRGVFIIFIITLTNAGRSLQDLPVPRDRTELPRFIPPGGVLGLIWMGLPTTWGPALPRALARSQSRCPTWLGTTSFTSQ